MPATSGVGQILNYRRISDEIGTGGQPTVDQFGDVKAAGYDVVINLAMPDSTNAIPNESELVAAQSMEYAHIPVVWEDPSDQDLERFLEVMDRHQEQRIFVHCARNWRVSAFMFLYQVIVRRVEQEVARQALEDVWLPNATWEDFLARMLERYGVHDSRGGDSGIIQRET